MKKFTRRKITTNKFTPRSDLGIRQADRDRIHDDLMQHTTQEVLIEPGKPVYIHNHTRNYLFALKQYKGRLASMKTATLAAWKKEAETLKSFIAKRETEFLAQANITATNSVSARNEFRKLVKETQNSVADIELLIKELTQHTKKIKRGIKELDDIRAIIKSLQKLSEKLQSRKYQFSSDFGSMPETLKNRQTAYAEFIAANRGRKGDTTKVAEKHLITGTGVSITSIINFILPSLVEGAAISTFRELFAGQFEEALNTTQTKNNFEIKSVAGSTAKGTTADIEMKINKSEFSISVKTSSIRQTKDRRLQTFYDWNKEMEKGGEADSILADGGVPSLLGKGKIMDSGSNATFISLANYTIMNYAYLNHQQNSLIGETMSILAIASLNEKLFGYNKTQQTESLAELLMKAPIAAINGENEVVFMSEVLDDILTATEAKIDALYSFSLTHYGYTGEIADGGARLIRKQSAANKLYQQKRRAIRDNQGKVTYASLKEGVERELAAANERLLKSIKVQIYYNINMKAMLKTINSKETNSV